MQAFCQTYALQPSSLSLVRLFVSLVASLEQQEFSILLKSSLLISKIFCVNLKKSLPNPQSLRFSPMLCSRRFIVGLLTFSPMSHFELLWVCVYDVGQRPKFIFCIQIVQVEFIEEDFPIVIIWHLCWKSADLYLFLRGLSILPP